MGLLTLKELNDNFVVLEWIDYKLSHKHKITNKEQLNIKFAQFNTLTIINIIICFMKMCSFLPIEKIEHT